MVVTTVRRGESIDRALKRFKHQCQRAGILRDFKKSRHYTKPSDRRKAARESAIRRMRRKSR